MKKPLLLLAAMLLSIVSAQGYAANRIDYTTKFDLPEELTKSNQKTGRQSTFSTLTLKDGGQYGEVGAPALPMKTFQFLVPVYTGKFTVTAKWPENPAFSAKLTERLKPVQKPFTTNEKFVETLPDEKAYSRTYEANARVVNDYFIDGSNHIVTVAVSPVTYDPVAGTLAIYDNVDLSLSYSDVSEAEMSMKPIFTEKPDKNLDLSEIVVNYTNPTKATSFDEPLHVATGTYIIISTKELMPAFDELANWKQMKGYNVIRQTIDNICKEYACDPISPTITDDAGKMRAFIRDCYKNHGRSYVLIGGDFFKTGLPIRFGYGEKNKITKDYYVPADLYFADMTGNWDSNNNNVYGEYGDNISFYGDMYIGRLYCNNALEVDNYTKKLILYECNPGMGDTKYLEKALVVRANDLDEHSNYTNYSESAINSTFSDVTKMFSSIDSNDEVYHGSQVVAEMNKNYGFNIIDGHGQPRKICVYNDKPNKLEYSLNAQESYKSHPEQDPGSGLDKLSNNLYPGIFYSYACDACPPDAFSSEYYSIKHFNMGSAYTTAGKYGGVAFIGNTRAGYCGVSPKLEGKFALLLSNGLKMGETFNKSRYNCSLINRNSTWHHLYLTYTLIGDPEMYIWTNTPNEFQISEHSAVIDGSLYLNSTDFPGASITISDGQEIIDCIQMQSSFNTNINLQNLENKTVTITKDGYKPISRLYGSNITVSDKRTYFVTDYNIDNSITVNNGGHLIIRATGSISFNGSLKILPGATVEIISDGNIYLKKGYYYLGGKLTTYSRGSVVTLSNFKIQGGAIIKKNLY